MGIKDKEKYHSISHSIHFWWKMINSVITVLTFIISFSAITSVQSDNYVVTLDSIKLTFNATCSVDSSMPTSCQEIKERMPKSRSSVYLIASKNAKTHYVYCNMETLCGSDDGWTRIAYLDMSDPSEECPSGFRQYQSNGVRACGRAVSSGGCQSLKFPSNGISYSEVCGRIVGYQYASTDAIDHTIGTGHGDINSHYVDGISLTHGNPRKHIWTFMAGLEVVRRDNFGCPCASSSSQTGKIPSFIGKDYFFESGTQRWSGGTLYIDDPLWDGKLCRSQEEPCCDVQDVPWFHKSLNSATTDYIELRLCSDQGTADEDVPFGLYEIYVKN